MSYRRRRRKTPFAQIPNAMLQDLEMGSGSVALVCYLLSKSRDWQGRSKDIEARFRVGEKERRNWTKRAEACGWLRMRRVRQPDGSLNQFYEANDDDYPLPPELRTDSSNLDSVPITELNEYLLEGDEGNEDIATGGTPPAKGGVPPPLPPHGVPPHGQPPHGSGGGLLNKEEPKTDLPKTEGLPPPLWLRLKTQMGDVDLLSHIDISKAYLKDAAVEACEAQYRAAELSCVPFHKPTFPADLKRWANALGFHSGNEVKVKANLQRALDYLALPHDQRNYNLPTWQILEEIGLGEKGMKKPPPSAARDPLAVQEELLIRRVENCEEAIKAGLRRHPRKGLQKVANEQASLYPLEVVERARAKVQGDQAFADELDELKKTGPLSLNQPARDKRPCVGATSAAV